MTVATFALDSGEPDVPGVDTAPWREWIIPNTAIADTDSLVRWLQHLEESLPEHATELREEEQRLAALWQHMSPKLAQFLPAEIEHVVAARLAATAKSAAAAALVDLVRVEQQRLSDPAPAGESQQSIDQGTLRRLLESIASDRVATGRTLTAEVLETLCSITLDLEVTERRVGGGASGEIADTLADLRSHVIAAADALRALPSNIEVHPQPDEQVVVAVRRCLGRYAGTLETQLDWQGPDPSSEESAAALVWVLQELLHHLHACTAGWAALSVHAEGALQAALSTPAAAFAVANGEPVWLMRCRLRLQLAGGSIATAAGATGSRVDIILP